MVNPALAQSVHTEVEVKTTVLTALYKMSAFPHTQSLPLEHMFREHTDESNLLMNHQVLHNLVEATVIKAKTRPTKY